MDSDREGGRPEEPFGDGFEDDYEDGLADFGAR